MVADEILPHWAYPVTVARAGTVALKRRPPWICCSHVGRLDLETFATGVRAHPSACASRNASVAAEEFVFKHGILRKVNSCTNGIQLFAKARNDYV
jgi:hypothetical protein